MSPAKHGLILLLALAAILAGCNRDVPRPDAPHPRIVSYAPSITQILFDMGLGEHVVAVTGQCQLPEGANRLRVGDALAVNAEAIVASEPDLVLIQMAPAKMDAVRDMSPTIRVEHFEIETLPDIAVAIERLGDLAGRPELGRQFRQQFERRLEGIRSSVAGLDRPRVMFLHGTNRPGSAGRGTFIDDMITSAGGVNAAGDYTGWVRVNLEQIIVAAPDVIICQAPPARAEAAGDYWSSIAALPAATSGRVHVITDRRLTIPSTVSPQFVQQIADLVHPGLSAGVDQP